MTETTTGAAMRPSIPRDTVFVGAKPVMTYATAVMMSFAPGVNELKLKARGNAISRAVDVAEVVNRRFFNGKLAKTVSIGTEVLGEGADQRNVSTIEIKLQKPEQ